MTAKQLLKAVAFKRTATGFIAYLRQRPDIRGGEGRNQKEALGRLVMENQAELNMPVYTMKPGQGPIQAEGEG